MGTRWYGGRVDAAGVAQLRAFAETGEIDRRVESVVRGKLLDIDKAWHGITRLLTGTPWEVTPGAGAAILGGEPLSEDEAVVNLLAPEEVRAIAADLDALDLDEVAGRYDAARFASEGIYPEIWDDEDVLDTYLLPYLRKVIHLYHSAAAAGDGVLTIRG